MHASVHQGMRLSRTRNRLSFSHNSPDALRRTLQNIRAGSVPNAHEKNSGKIPHNYSSRKSDSSFSSNTTTSSSSQRRSNTSLIYVAVESVYSMGGDPAPLRELCEVCEEFGAALIVDEAHSTGTRTTYWYAVFCTTFWISSLHTLLVASAMLYGFDSMREGGGGVTHIRLFSLSGRTFGGISGMTQKTCFLSFSVFSKDGLR